MVRGARHVGLGGVELDVQAVPPVSAARGPRRAVLAGEGRRGRGPERLNRRRASAVSIFNCRRILGERVAGRLDVRARFPRPGRDGCFQRLLRLRRPRSSFGVRTGQLTVTAGRPRERSPMRRAGRSPFAVAIPEETQRGLLDSAWRARPASPGPSPRRPPTPRLTLARERRLLLASAAFASGVVAAQGPGHLRMVLIKVARVVSSKATWRCASATVFRRGGLIRGRVSMLSRLLTVLDRALDIAAVFMLERPSGRGCP